MYNVRTICKSDGCKKCGIQKAVKVDFTEALNFNGKLDHTVSINHMAVEEIITSMRNIRSCSACRRKSNRTLPPPAHISIDA